MEATNLIRETVQVTDLKGGDTVEVRGELKTVSAARLRRGFTGPTYNGDPFRKGITRITFKVPTLNGYRYE